MKLTKRISLRISPEAYRYHQRQAIKEKRSFNNYLNHLLTKDVPERELTQQNQLALNVDKR